MKASPSDATFFETPAELRAWLDEHAATETELWVGLHRRATGRASLTWAQAVDELLCVGWIDSRGQTLGDGRWALRVTPRRQGSNWSAVNLVRVPELVAEGRMAPAGLRAFEARDPAKVPPYSYEGGPIPLDQDFEERLRVNAAAWAWFSAQPPSYRRVAGHWVMSAKRDETRLRRLDTLIDDSANGRPIKPLSYGRKP